jgi:4-diphosphocytidyl-2-C-methyl-D-erythritol kinase
LTPRSLTLPSFAKINWSVRVLGRRPDGYHEVRTILQTVSLKDELRFEVTNDGDLDLTCDHAEIPTDDRNLIVRAAGALQQRFSVSAGAQIQLVKTIPTQAGLGGGSSNAAVSLLALSQLWRVPARRADLLEIAAKIGADVPFFFYGGSAAGTGTGATVSPLEDCLELNSQHLVIVTPNATVATVDAYAALNLPALTTLPPEPILSSLQTHAKSGNSHQWPAHDQLQDNLRNDFEAVIFEKEPEIKRAGDTLREAGATGVLLAGSGSSVFGIFANRETQQHAVSTLRAEDGWRIFPCVTLSRDEYRRQMSPELFHFFDQGY